MRPRRRPRARRSGSRGDRAELGTWNGTGLALVRGADGVWTGRAGVARGHGDRVQGDARRLEPRREGRARRRDRQPALDRGGRRHGAHRGGGVARRSSRNRAPRASRRSRVTCAGIAAFPSRFVSARDVLVWLPPGYDGADEAALPGDLLPRRPERVRRRHELHPRAGVGRRRDSRPARARGPAAALHPGGGRQHVGAHGRVHVGAPTRRTAAARARSHQRFLLEELKPFVDRTYRTQPEAAAHGRRGQLAGRACRARLAAAAPRGRGHGRLRLARGVVGGHRDSSDACIAGTGHSGRVWLDIGTAESTPTETGARPWLDSARALHEALMHARAGATARTCTTRRSRAPGTTRPPGAARVDRILPFLLAAAAKR